MAFDLTVYVHSITPRVRYTFNLLFEELLGVELEITDSSEVFSEAKGPKVSYAYQPLDASLNFVPNGLLFEKGIEQFDISVNGQGEKATFFTVSNSALQFDVFSASFYLVSRYEEYLPHVKDKHGRFSAKHSLANKNQFIETPLINLWALELREIITKAFPELVLGKKKFIIEPSIDVDSAFAYKEKGLVRSIAGIGKDLIYRDLTGLKNRLLSILGNRPDPFDVFDRVIEYQKKYKLKFLFFFLVGDYDTNDRSISITSRKFQSTIKHVNDYSDVGLHPSFASNESKEKLGLELNRLSRTLHYPVTKSRQHFLKLRLPDSYRNLIDLGIVEDYSMGYPDLSGFRASICTPFNFYDLEQETETNLRLHPFCFMEATYKYYQSSSSNEMVSTGIELAKTVKAVGGTFSFVWHSDSLSGLKPWEGWEDALENFLNELKSL